MEAANDRYPMPGVSSPEAKLRAAGGRILREPGEPFELLTLADCAAAPMRGYIWKGVLAPGDLAVLFGPPGAGKSVIAPFIAHGVARGKKPIFGKRVRQGPVLYIACEDGAGMKLRARALLAVRGTADAFRIIAQEVDLQGDGVAEPADLAAIKQAAEKFKAALIVLDTMARAFPGLDENDGRSMGRATRILRQLCTPQRAVLAVHHGAKTGGDTPRGHGVLNGDCDVTMRIETAESGARTITLGKNRNGSTLQRFGFTIRSEFLETDEDGDAVTAPVAEEIEATEGGDKGPQMSGQVRAALDRLSDLVGTSGDKLPAGPHFPSDPSVRGVRWAAWRDCCKARPIAASDEKEAIKKAFTRASQALLNSKIVAAAEHGEERFVWIVREKGTKQ
jgi:hypothetical protein